MNLCRRCESEYEKPGTCNCFAEKAPREPGTCNRFANGGASVHYHPSNLTAMWAEGALSFSAAPVPCGVDWS